MRRKKLLGRSAIAFASAAVIAGGAIALDVRMAFAEEKSEVTEIGTRDDASEMANNNVNTDSNTSTESNVNGDSNTNAEGNVNTDTNIKEENNTDVGRFYESNIEWSGRSVNVIEHTELQDGDLSLTTALEKALNHIEDMSGKDLRNAAFIQIVLDTEYIDEGDIRYGNVLPRREYTVYIDVEAGEVLCDGYNVTMNAVTGEIYEYGYWNSEAAYSADCGPMDEFNEYYDQKTEAECIEIALDFQRKEFGEDIISVSEPVTVMYVTEFGMRYSTVVYISLLNGDVISVEVDYSDKKVYRYAINPREIYWSPAGDDTTETDTNTEDCTDDDVLNPDTSCYIEWNGREVNFTESYIRLQDSDLDLATALDNALNHIKEMSGKDLSDASFIQIALENKYIDEDDATYENESSRREYTVRFDIRDGELVYEEYNVVMNAVTGEIYEYNHWDYEIDDSEDSDTANENCEQATEEQLYEFLSRCVHYTYS